MVARAWRLSSHPDHRICLRYLTSGLPKLDPTNTDNALRPRFAPRVRNKPFNSGVDDPKRWSQIPSEEQYMAQLRGPPSATAIATQRQIREDQVHPADLLQAKISEDDAPLDLIRVCLQAYFEQIQQVPSHADRVLLVTKKPVAAPLLGYLWSREEVWLQLVLTDPETTKWTCHFAVMEGLEDLMMEWIKMDLSRVTPEPAQEKAEHRALWRNSLFRLLIETRLKNASDGKADEALKLFFTTLEERAELYKSALESLPPEDRRRSETGAWEDLGLPMWVSMSFWPASVVLGIHLGTGKYPHTDAKLYQRFLGYVEKIAYKGTPGQRQLALARLYLYKSDRPDSSYATTFFRERLEGKSKQQVRNYLLENKAIRGVFHSTLRDIVRLSRQLGKNSDAELLNTFKREHFWKHHKAAPSEQLGFRVWRTKC
ncbi:hypothetical protein LTR17_021226 [Elasticomyces elasticus]|nr:hypothetical protein LTR17_021226 [Elasticomyces elasticus]